MNGIIRDRRKIVIVLLLLILSGLSNAQQQTNAQRRYKVRNVFWYTPGGAKEINGLALGIQATNFNETQLTINGLNIDAGLVALMAWPEAIGTQIRFGKKRVDEELYKRDSTPPETAVNGISISFGGELSCGINGIGINAGVLYAPYINGISFTGLVSACGSFKGIVIGGFSNVAVQGVGLQIGLINNCKKLKGLQIGLWNRSGKRALPFINWGV